MNTVYKFLLSGSTYGYITTDGYVILENASSDAEERYKDEVSNMEYQDYYTNFNALNAKFTEYGKRIGEDPADFYCGDMEDSEFVTCCKSGLFGAGGVEDGIVINKKGSGFLTSITPNGTKAKKFYAVFEGINALSADTSDYDNVVVGISASGKTVTAMLDGGAIKKELSELKEKISDVEKKSETDEYRHDTVTVSIYYVPTSEEKNRPSTPNGGAYDFSARKVTELPEGWVLQDGVDTEDGIFWMSQGTFYSDDSDENLVSTSVTWSTPIKFSNNTSENGVDNDDTEYVYTRTKGSGDSDRPSAPDWNQTYKISNQYTDSHGTVWHDHAEDITADWRCVWVSSRIKEDGTWSTWSEPVRWSRWGEDGTDGDGIEYIYTLTSSGSALDAPTAANSPTGNRIGNQAGIAWNDATFQNDDFIPAGWSDNPQEPSESMDYEWVSVRKKKSGKWQEFSTPTIWSRYVSSAESGTSVTVIGSVASSSELCALYESGDVQDGDMVYCEDDGHMWVYYKDTEGDEGSFCGFSDVGCFRGADGQKGDKGNTGEKGASGYSAYVHMKYATSVARLSENDPDTFDWTDDSGEVIDGAKFIGMYVDQVETDSKYPKYDKELGYDTYKWSKFVGKDGNGYEYVFISTKDEESRPPIPNMGNSLKNNKIGTVSGVEWTTDNYQQDDFIPYGWSDNPEGVSSDKTREWMVYRKKTDGLWSEFMGTSDGQASLYAVFEQGISGQTGKSGLIIYPAGFYSESTTYSRTETSTPYVIDPNDGNMYIFDNNGEVGTAVGKTPSENVDNGIWIKGEKYQFVFTDALVADYGVIASTVFYKSWMFSQQGTTFSGGTSNDADYKYFNADLPCPQLVFKSSSADCSETSDGVVYDAYTTGSDLSTVVHIKLSDGTWYEKKLLETFRPNWAVDMLSGKQYCRNFTSYDPYSLRRVDIIDGVLRIFGKSKGTYVEITTNSGDTQMPIFNYYIDNEVAWSLSDSGDISKSIVITNSSTTKNLINKTHFDSGQYAAVPDATSESGIWTYNTNILHGAYSSTIGTTQDVVIYTGYTMIQQTIKNTNKGTTSVYLYDGSSKLNGITVTLQKYSHTNWIKRFEKDFTSVSELEEILRGSTYSALNMSNNIFLNKSTEETVVSTKMADSDRILIYNLTKCVDGVYDGIIRVYVCLMSANIPDWGDEITYSAS